MFVSLIKKTSKVQRLTIPACKKCNNSWSNDEAHFRDILVIAGENPNPLRRELFNTKIHPSFFKSDGQKRLLDIVSVMIPITVNGKKRSAIYPAKDERVIHVVKKIVRGLCYYHNVLSQVSNQRIWIDVLKYNIPEEFLDNMKYEHREQDIVNYKWEVLNYEEINSVWIITFFNKVTFIGLVAAIENGFT